jgi:general secretion pathway protein K
MRFPMCRTNVPDRGFALLIVAITLAVLSLVFGAALATSRQHLSAAASQIDRVQTGAAADGAIAIVEHDLVTAGALPPAVLSAPQPYMIGGVQVEVSVRWEAAKLDLNAVSLDVLKRYLTAAGASRDTTRALVAAIEARRKLANLTGKESRYERHDDQRFQTISEFADIKGMNDDLFDCIAPDLTVFTGGPLPSAEGASPRIRAALGVGGDAGPRPSAAPVASGLAIVAGEIFEITADAKARNSDAHFIKQVVARITGNRTRPVWTLAESTPNPLSARQACERLKHGRDVSATNAD